jgi:hypothetical protein
VLRIAEAARAARRDQIITAGLACFARSGYHATTMADVAAQAGVSKGTPYLYFDSKQALFLALHQGTAVPGSASTPRSPPSPAQNASPRARCCTRSRPRSPRTSWLKARPAGC